MKLLVESRLERINIRFKLKFKLPKKSPNFKIFILVSTINTSSKSFIGSVFVHFVVQTFNSLPNDPGSSDDLAKKS